MEFIFEAGREVFLLELSTSPMNRALAVATVSATSTSLDCVTLPKYWRGLAAALFEAGKLAGTVPLPVGGVNPVPTNRADTMVAKQRQGATLRMTTGMANGTSEALHAPQAVSGPSVRTS